MPVLDEKTASRLYRTAKADRWSLAPARFAEAVEASIARAFSGATPNSRELERYLSSLHVEDLALACACADGHEAAWEVLVRDHRPALYRAADALDAGGGARDLADSIYGELYARSLLRYFHGRSSLATWLRSVLAQRHVDRLRSRQRLEALPDDEAALASASPLTDLDAVRYHRLMETALRGAIDSLSSRDRLRLGCYYAQQLTLAETGRLLHEHEATCSRHLAKTRKVLRQTVERSLRASGLSDAEVGRCFEVSLEDAGALDLDRMFSGAAARKISDRDRSE